MTTTTPDHTRHAWRWHRRHLRRQEVRQRTAAREVTAVTEDQARWLDDGGTQEERLDSTS